MGANIHSSSPSIDNLAKSIGPYAIYLLWTIRLIPATGIIYAIYPLLAPKDDLSDIPLTPSQRSLLGLQPAVNPATPGSRYITPPRYARSVTPRSDNSRSGSPFSGRDSVGSTAGTTYSPNASPLLHKAVGREARRQSLGAATSLGYTKSMTESSTALVTGTPSPNGGRNNASVGLNNRWLYEKGRGSPAMRSVYS